nr:putative ribonuclease H-like domain-containing protein [Tanacetum cinerariifolium]
MYRLVVADDYSRFSWVFFLVTKDETSGILKAFITGIKNLIDHKVKIIRCDNGTEFKNKEMNQFCEKQGIKREFSVARTPQHNGVAERKNRTLIEAARTMLADSKLPTSFWAEAVNTTCYVQNKEVNAVGSKSSIELLDDPNMFDLEDIGIFEEFNKDVGVEAKMNNMDTNILVIPIPTTKIHKDHPVEQIIRDIHSAPQTRRMTKSVTDHGNGYHQKDKIKAKPDKTEHEMAPRALDGYDELLSSLTQQAQVAHSLIEETQSKEAKT